MRRLRAPRSLICFEVKAVFRLLICCFLCGLLAGLSLLPERSRAAAKPGFTVQGDSLSVMTRRETRQALRDFRQLSFSAAVGRHYFEGERLLARQRLGRVVFFVLGTNDWQGSGRAFEASLRRVLARVGPGRCLVVASLFDNRPVYAWNRLLYRLADRFGPARMQVAGWSEAVSAGRASLSDGVHPAGSRDARVRAALLARAARACLAA